jgi:hypothetical protein
MSICVYIKASPNQPPSIKDYILRGTEDCKEDIEFLDLLRKYEDKCEIYGIYDTKKEAEERKEKLQFEKVQCGFFWCRWYEEHDEVYSTITLDIFIKEESGMYIVYKTIIYDDNLCEGEGYYEEPFMISLEDHGFDEYTFHKTIRMNQPININIQQEGCISSEFLYNEPTKQWITPYWSPTIEFHSLLGAHRIMGPVLTVLLIDFRIQWQEEIELVTEDTRQIAHRISLPTLPTEVWFEILRMLKVRHFGVSLI